MQQPNIKLPFFSVVIPVYNEEGSLETLTDEIILSLASINDKNFEIIYVDDGSSDSTPIVLNNIQSSKDCVKVITLATNYGKSSAYAAGFDSALGEVVITLDGDLQDDPKEIRKVYDVLKEGYDLVIGYKVGRLTNEPHKKIPSTVFNYLKHMLFGIALKDSNSGFRIMRRSVAKNLRLYGDRHRFIPELALAVGFEIAETPVNHRKRIHGHSKYNSIRFFTGFLDLLTIRFLTKHKHKPSHIFGIAGTIPMCIGLSLEIYVLVYKLYGSHFIRHITAFITGVMFLLIGFQIYMIGLIGELIMSQSSEPTYRILNKEIKS